MILLDTNVVSEPLRPRPAPQVLTWIDAQAIETLHLSTITLAELRFGVAAMAEGARRCGLRRQLEDRVVPLFEGRIFSFDLDAAAAYAELRARAQRAGKAISAADGYIAAIAVARGLAVATRDVSPFEAAGVKIINPWES